MALISLHKNRFRFLLSVFFIAAGLYHFINPGFYLPLIPPYFSNPGLINIVSGILEIAAGLFLLKSGFHHYGGRLIVFLMIAFIPSHIYFIQIGGCVEGGLCVQLWVAWARLLLIHPVLIWLGYKFTKTKVDFIGGAYY